MNDEQGYEREFGLLKRYAKQPATAANTLLCELRFEEILSRFVHPPACDRGTGQLHGNLGSRSCPQPFADEGSLFGGGA